MRSIVRYLRLVPALVLVAIQVAMTAAPVAASTTPAPPEVLALERLYKVDRLALCNQQDPANQAHERACPWCQGFGQAVLPEEAPVASPPVFGLVPRIVPVTEDAYSSKVVMHRSRSPPAWPFRSEIPV